MSTRGMSLSALRDPQYRKAISLLVTSRHSAGVSQADLAATLSKPQSFVSKYERFERRLDVIEFGRILRALGLDPVSTLQDLL